MRRFLFVMFLTGSLDLFAAVPKPVITVGEVHGAFAVVAGRLESPPERPLGISVLNGNIISSVVTDTEGRWSTVIRHLSTQVSVSSWDLLMPQDRSDAVSGGLLKVSSRAK